MNELVPILTWALVLGAAGSLHCIGMCGPLTLAVSRMGPQTRGRIPWSQLAHHLGRITTYLLLGFTIGSLGRTVTIAGWQQGLSLGLGFMLIVGVTIPQGNRFAVAAKRMIGKQIRHLIPRSTRTDPLSRFALGLAHGLLPCGLVYVALAGAATTAGPLQGAATMAAFGIATLPSTFGLAWIVQLGWGKRFPTTSRWLVPGLALVTGSLLILRASGLGIPYLSPNLETPDAPQCCTATATSIPHSH